MEEGSREREDRKSGSLGVPLARLYDRMASHTHRVLLERWVVKLGALGFLVHLTLIFLARSLPTPPALIADVGKNYFAAIDTPFNFILFYEVLVLIAAIPESMLKSVARQFEITSLIFLRNFFKDLATVNDAVMLPHYTAEMRPILVDAGASLLMFLLVAVFHQVSLKRMRAESVAGEEAEPATLIVQKKAIALLFTIGLFALALYTIAELIVHYVRGGAGGPDLHPYGTFYANVFIAMIFIDVLILILSIAQSDSYALVFRNAAFVISTILIRFSLSSEQPYAAPLALLGMVFGILNVLIYNYSSKVERRYRDHGSTVNP